MGDPRDIERPPPPDVGEALAALIREPDGSDPTTWPGRVVEAVMSLAIVHGVILCRREASDPIIARAGSPIDASTATILGDLLWQAERRDRIAFHPAIPGMLAMRTDDRHALIVHTDADPGGLLLANLATAIPFATAAARAHDDLLDARERVDSHRQVERHIAESLSGVADLDGLGRAVIRVMALLFDVEQSAIYLREPGGTALRLVTAHGFEPWEQAEAERTAWERHPGRVIRSGKRFLTDDVRLDPTGTTDNSARRFEIRSRCWLPVNASGEVIGALGAASPRVGAFNEDHLAGFQFLADIAGLTWGRLLEMARRRRRDEILVAVGEVLRVLLEAEHWRDALPTVLESIRSSFGCRSARFIEPDGSSIGDAPNDPPVTPAFVEATRSGPHGGLVGPGGHAIPGLGAEMRPIPHSFVAVPVVVEDRLLGAILATDDSDARTHDRNSITALRAFVDPLASRIAREEIAESRRKNDRIEALGQLAGGVAHDINNLLMPILGLSSALAAEEPDAKRRSQLESIGDAAVSGRDFVEKVLLLTRSHVSTDEPTALHETVRQAIRDTCPTDDPRIRVDERIVETTVPGDRTAILQMVRQLLINARESIGDREGRIDVELARAPAHGMIELRIEDDGRGMSSETRARLFDPFFTTHRDASSRGLGLTIVQRVATELGGFVSIDSDTGRGTTVTVTLPIKEDHSTVASEIDPPTASSSSPSASSTGWILVVDDDEMVRSTTVALLESFDHRVRPAASGKAALKMAVESPEDPPALVLTDLSMPEMDGVALVTELRRAGITSPCAIITGFGEDSIDVARDAGVDLVIRKPISRAELGTVIDGLLGDDGGHR